MVDQGIDQGIDWGIDQEHCRQLEVVVHIDHMVEELVHSVVEGNFGLQWQQIVCFGFSLQEENVRKEIKGKNLLRMTKAAMIMTKTTTTTTEELLEELGVGVGVG